MKVFQALKKQLFISTFLLVSFTSPLALSAEYDYVTGKSELGVPFKLLKSEWPRAFACMHWGGAKAGKLAFSIRKNSATPIGNKNAWLIFFSDLAGYSGSLYRDGLDWRFDWTDRNTNRQFSVVIGPDGAGYYYNWALADSDGRMNATRTVTCE